MAAAEKTTAYLDPGTGTTIWQSAAVVLIGILFYVRRIADWLRTNLAFRSAQTTGFLFASVFGAAISPLAIRMFGGHPLPRFNDIFLVGIVLAAYLFTWESAAYLLTISIAVSAWLLPPSGTFRVEGVAEWYRLISFALISIFLIMLITRIKVRRTAEPLAGSRMHDVSEEIPSMAGGD